MGWEAAQPRSPYRRGPAGATQCRLSAGHSPSRTWPMCHRQQGVVRAPCPPPCSAAPGRPRKSHGSTWCGMDRQGMRVHAPQPHRAAGLTASWHWRKGSVSSIPHMASAARCAVLPMAQPGLGSTASLQESCARMGSDQRHPTAVGLCWEQGGDTAPREPHRVLGWSPSRPRPCSA